MATNTAMVGQFLAQYGWQYEARGQDLLATGFRGAMGSFRLYIQVAEPWVLLVVVPLVPRPTPPCRDRLARYMSRLNYQLALARLAIDDDGDVALMAEVAGEGMRYEDLTRALEVLSFYADEHYMTLANLATDPAYVPRDRLDLWEGTPS